MLKFSQRSFPCTDCSGQSAMFWKEVHEYLKDIAYLLAVSSLLIWPLFCNVSSLERYVVNPFPLFLTFLCGWNNVRWLNIPVAFSLVHLLTVISPYKVALIVNWCFFCLPCLQRRWTERIWWWRLFASFFCWSPWCWRQLPPKGPHLITKEVNLANLALWKMI